MRFVLARDVLNCLEYFEQFCSQQCRPRARALLPAIFVAATDNAVRSNHDRHIYKNDFIKIK